MHGKNHMSSSSTISKLHRRVGGKASRSSVDTLYHGTSVLLHSIKVQNHTGRTNQIRLHMRQVRATVQGNYLYGLHDFNLYYA